jgi:hypothetical protein
MIVSNIFEYISKSKFIDYLLVLVIFMNLLFLIYSFFEPNIVLLSNKNNIVKDYEVVNKLEKSIAKYYNAVINEQIYIANEMESIFNKSNIDKIKNISMDFSNNSQYELKVKNAYYTINDVYLCDVDILDKIGANKYNFNNSMSFKVTIKYSKDTGIFKIIKMDKNNS